MERHTFTFKINRTIHQFELSYDTELSGFSVYHKDCGVVIEGARNLNSNRWYVMAEAQGLYFVRTEFINTVTKLLQQLIDKNIRKA